jgi:hypothetical protein
MKPYLILIITLSCVLVGCSTTFLKTDSGEAKELNASSSSRPLYEKVPWDWLLGHWDIENSDGKKTKVQRMTKAAMGSGGLIWMCAIGGALALFTA